MAKKISHVNRNKPALPIPQNMPFKSDGSSKRESAAVNVLSFMMNGKGALITPAMAKKVAKTAVVLTDALFNELEATEQKS